MDQYCYIEDKWEALDYIIMNINQENFLVNWMKGSGRMPKETWPFSLRTLEINWADFCSYLEKIDQETMPLAQRRSYWKSE